MRLSLMIRSYLFSDKIWASFFLSLARARRRMGMLATNLGKKNRDGAVGRRIVLEEYEIAFRAFSLQKS